MIDLSGRKILVTGGSRGIGAACCRLLAQGGAAVAIQYVRDREAAEGVLAEVQKSSDQAHLMIGADLLDESGARSMMLTLDKEWGRLDCLVNNAGIWVRNPIDELDEARMQETWALNISAVFRCVHEAIPLLRKSESPSVVNISSTAGQRGEAFYSPYGASKGALIAATKSWSTELAPEIRVNCVAPGWVDTDMCTEAFSAGGREKIERGIPLARVASPEDIAGPVAFLASDLSRHVTGEILNVNGGSVLAG